MPLPPTFQKWFDAKGWSPHDHQLDIVAACEPSVLLIAPTGGGKTLAGFLPTLIELSTSAGNGLHTLYVSPLKALAADIRRNLQRPIEEMGLDIRVEDRTGDTTQTARKRQRADPPDILLTTPESLAVLLSYPDAPRIFGSLQRVIVDEIHALADSKRGDQLFLGLSRLETISPGLRRTGLSATVENPPEIADCLAAHRGGCRIILADPGPEPDIRILETHARPPWSGMGGRYAARDVMEAIARHRVTLVFINTRAQAELFFQALWAANPENLPIGLHHGSLSRDARSKVEAAMVSGDLRAVVCTGSLDLGIDWGNVDLVVQVGAPKNVARLVQRIGRANHRYNAPSKALLVPSNMLEVLECEVALQAVRAHDLDGEPRQKGPRDVLCQHILLTACSGAFDADLLYGEVLSAGPYRNLTRDQFNACLEYCATGGYALRAYDRWKRLTRRPDRMWELRDPRRSRALRMNIGTIVDTETLKVRMHRRRGGAPIGEVEESFAASLTPGDTFLIGGQVVRYEGLRDMVVEVSPSPSKTPQIAVFSGGKLSMSTQLSHRLLDLINDRDEWSALPPTTRDVLQLQSEISALPPRDRLLVESFSRDERAYTAFHGFAGRNAHQTLGLIVTRAMEAAGLEPLGFVSTDVSMLIWGLQPVSDPAALLRAPDLRKGLRTWLAGNAVMKRTFRNVATVAGLIERNLPGQRKSGKQATFSSDILYDTLRKYDPEHLILQITQEEAMRGLVDFDRIEEMLSRIDGRVLHVHAPHVTPLSAPLLLEVGKVPIHGAAEERMLAQASDALIAEAMRKPLE